MEDKWSKLITTCLRLGIVDASMPIIHEGWIFMYDYTMKTRFGALYE